MLEVVKAGLMANVFPDCVPASWVVLTFVMSLYFCWRQ